MARRDEQEHAERRIDADDHGEIMLRVALPPDPARGPHDAPGINSEDEGQADRDQGDAKIEQAVCVGHFQSPGIARSLAKTTPEWACWLISPAGKSQGGSDE